MLSQKIDPKNMEGLLPLLKFAQSVGVLANNKSAKDGMKMFMSIFGPINAFKISFFLKRLAKAGDGKVFENAAKLLTAMADLIINLGAKRKEVKKGIELLKIITDLERKDKVGTGIGEFYKALFSNMPKANKTQITTFNAVFEILGNNKIGILSLWTLSKLGKEIEPSSAKNISEFISELLKPFKGIKKNEVDATKKILSSIGKVILMIVASIGILMALVLIDLGALLIATGITAGIILGIAVFTKYLAKNSKDISKGTQGLEAVGKAIFLVVTAIGIMTLLVKFDLKNTVIATVISLGIMLAMVELAKLLTGDNQKQLTEGVKGLKKLSVALLLVTASVGIMALLITTFELDVVFSGTIIVLSIMLAMVGLAKLLAVDKEDKLTNGINGL